MSPQKLILRSFQSPGDILMMTAAVRDLHEAYPGQFLIDVRTSVPELWDHNPRITSIPDGDLTARTMDLHYPLIHHCNQRPYHFLHGFAQYLEAQLDLHIPVTQFRGDVHLSDDERSGPPRLDGVKLPDRYWIIVAGGKYDFTTKWWNPASYQSVVNHFRGRISFVQCGEAGHWHPPLDGVVNLVGKTSTRQFVHLMHFAEGVVCPVTFAMHLASAVETPRGRPRCRPCVVVAGGREPAHWEAYPGHQFISNNGALSCCQTGGCWKSRCQLVGDGDEKDRSNLCEQPVLVADDLRIPRCMDMITAEDVIRRIELYFQGGALSWDGNGAEPSTPPPKTSVQNSSISVAFQHGLGDCAYFAHLLPLYIRRGYEVEVECTPDKEVLFQAAGARTIRTGAKTTHPWAYPPGGTFEGHGQYWQGSKMAHNISQPPLPDIGAPSNLWEEYVDARVDVESQLSDSARRTAEQWIAKIPRPVVLLHSKGNTGQNRKSLPDDVAAEFYRAFLDECDGSLVLLDWDRRVPRMNSYRVRGIDTFGPCPTDVLLALMQRVDLMVGVDSGPLHVARFTDTRTIGLWMPGHYPTTYSLPRRQQLNVVLGEHTRQWNKYKRIPWNIVEQPGSQFEAARLASWCRDMLAEPRYLDRNEIAADVQLRQFVGQWCRGLSGNDLSSYSDRNRSFDLLLHEMTRRFERPTVVETGTIRAEEDWSGAGFFTYLMGTYLWRRGGRLYSVDLAPQHCQFARDWTAQFAGTVEVHQQDSVEFLRAFQQPIDVLYLDSLDTTEPRHAEHALAELQAAYGRLHKRSLVLMDDTPWHGGAWVGKGARAAPWLLEQGWKLLYGGYQVLFSRTDE